MDYQITPISVKGFAPATGVYENQEGAWLGEVDWQNDTWLVKPYSNEDGDYIPAPGNWRDLVVVELEQTPTSSPAAPCLPSPDSSGTL